MQGSVFLEDLRIVHLEDMNEIRSALSIAEEVFMEFEAPYFVKRGTESFLNFLWGRRLREMISDGEMQVWGCFARSGMIGMMALRGGSHISLAFVKSEFHRMGAGRMLFSEAKKYALTHGITEMTVNASDYGLPFYKAMGFMPADMQSVSDGIISTPMKAYI